MRHSFTKKLALLLSALGRAWQALLLGVPADNQSILRHHTRYVHARLVANLTQNAHPRAEPGAGAVGIDGLTRHPIVAP